MLYHMKTITNII